MTDTDKLIEAMKSATRFNSPDHQPGFRRVGFILPADIAWPEDYNAGWTAGNQDDEELFPTHWMPLLSPPVESSNG